MADADEIIDYMRSLKKGFDKELFECKIEELAHIVEISGLDYDDFHTLFKIWLNLTIPITKWMNFGYCLIPRDKVEERTVEYALRWLLAKRYENQASYSRIGFLLDWLTVAMDCDSIDMVTLDAGYELFYNMLTYELLTSYALKLMYKLTKPVDITRRRVLELFDLAKTREGQKNVYRQLQVLLGLFKSYKPECVPEDIPAISVYTSFKKSNATLHKRFKINQERRNCLSTDMEHLLWVNPVNSKGRNKNLDPLVPNLELINIGSQQYKNNANKKTYLDFSEPVSLVQYAVRHGLERPARLRALLSNTTGLTMLALADDAEHAFLSHDLQHLLTACFLDGSNYSYTEKEDFLHRLGVLQETLMQGIPVITRFLSQYLVFWNEKDYFHEILKLLEWVHVDSANHVTCLLEPLKKIFHRSQPLQQCAILNSLTNMYSNMLYASKRGRQYFGVESSQQNYAEVLPVLAHHITDICDKALQVNPDDVRTVYSCVSSIERLATAQVRFKAPLTSLPRAHLFASVLLANGAALLDKLAGLVRLYRKLIISMKKSNHDEMFIVQLQNTLDGVVSDVISCLYSEVAFKNRKEGLAFNKLHPQLVATLCKTTEADSLLSIRKHLAFVPYTVYIQQDMKDVRNMMIVIDDEFSNLSWLLNTAISRGTVPS